MPQSLFPTTSEAIEPLLPHELLKPKGGCPRIPASGALGGIIFILRTECPWRLLPKELGCGSGTNVLATAARLATSRRLAAAA